MLLAVAGSETTATVLSGSTYLLCKNPETLAKLQAEVRGKFKHSHEITLQSVNDLDYMLAVINEALRCYPPVAGGNVRVVPGKDGAEIAGHFVPSGVSSNHRTTKICIQTCILTNGHVIDICRD